MEALRKITLFIVVQFAIIFPSLTLIFSPLLLTDGLLIEIYVIQALKLMMFIYLCRKCVALDAVLAAELIMKAVMNVNLMKSIAIRERTARQIDWRLIANLHVAAAHSTHATIAPV
jgi:hypothetical protein